MSTTEPGNLDPSDAGAPHISAQDARGGEIILRTKRRRGIFIGGLVGAALIGILALV